MLCEYFNIKKEKGKYEVGMELNYFSITVFLFYMRDKKRYADLRIVVENHIFRRFKKRKKILMKDAELTLLLFDTLACPYISQDLKQRLLELYDIYDPLLQNSIISYRPYWFTKWSNFNFGKELDAKRSQEVY